MGNQVSIDEIDPQDLLTFL